MRERATASATLGLFFLLAPLAAQQPPATIEEEVEVREVGVVADLPERLRGRDAAELVEQLTVIEGGIARQPVSVEKLASDGTAYGRVLVLVDRLRCNEEIQRAATAALGAQAERLTGLGPVEIAELGGRFERAAGPTRSPEVVAAGLARVAGSACAPMASAATSEPVDLAAADLSCPRTPCLLVWVGPGWGGGSADGAPRPASRAEIEPLARRLAGAGWLFLAAPITPPAPAETKRNVPEPENRPGSDRHTFGVGTADRGGAQSPLSAEEYEKFVDVWLAPLRGLVGATAGELVDRPDELQPALVRLADRSILWYRTDREPGDEPVALEVRERSAEGRRYRAPAWAPESGR